MLQLAGDRSVLEIAAHGHEQLVVARIQVVENRARQRAAAVEPVEQPPERAPDLHVRNRVEPDVRSGLLEHGRVVVAQRPVVILLGPVLGGIHFAE